MENSTMMSSKGQLVIPVRLRKQLGFKPGTRVVFRKHGKGLHIEPSGYEAVMALCGKYAGLPLEETLTEARRVDEEKLEARYEDLRS